MGLNLGGRTAPIDVMTLQACRSCKRDFPRAPRSIFFCSASRLATVSLSDSFYRMPMTLLIARATRRPSMGARRQRQANDQ
jgi:hypothetical protein